MKTKRNTLAGKGKSNNHEGTGRDYKKEYKEYQGSAERKKYRAELNKANKEMGSKRYDGKDLSHTKSGKLVKESQSANRSRNGHGKNGQRLK
jgi:hypothetical protein